MGLRFFEIHAHPSIDLVRRGFSDKMDKYLWGVISIQCSPEGQEITEDTCGNRKLITTLTSALYVLFAIAALTGSIVILIQTMAATPLTHYLPIMILYASAIGTTLIPLLIFDIWLRPLLSDPHMWGLADHKIHITFTGKESPSHISYRTQFESVGIPACSIMNWVSFGCFIVSFVSFVYRYKRSMKLKSYVYSDSSFMRQKSILAPATGSAEEGKVSAISVDELIRSRRQPPR
jgi:hypothetical protein